MQDFDKHIKNILENPPETPVNERVWKKVQTELHPRPFSWERLWWLLPLAFLPFIALTYFLSGVQTNKKDENTEKTSLTITDTIYKQVVIHQYDTIYRHTVVVEKTHTFSANTTVPIFSWQQAPLQGFGSSARFMRSDFRPVGSNPRWGTFAQQFFNAPKTGSTAAAKTSEHSMKTAEKGPGLSALPFLKNKLSIPAYTFERSLSTSPFDLEAAQAASAKSSRRSRFLKAVDQSAQALAPDAFGFGFSTAAEFFLGGSMEHHVANANGLSFSLHLNPRMRLLGGIDIASINYNEFESDHFDKYPYVSPPSQGLVLARIEPYLTYYRIPLGMEWRLHKGAHSFEPYLQGGLFWIRKSEKNHLEYYFTDPQTNSEHIKKYALTEEGQKLNWRAGSWWLSAGVDWHLFSQHRNLYLRGQATYVQYAAGLEPQLSFLRGLGLRASLAYTLPFK